MSVHVPSVAPHGARFRLRDYHSDAAKLANERAVAVKLVSGGERVETSHRCSGCFKFGKVYAVALTASGNVSLVCLACKHRTVLPRDAFAPLCAEPVGDVETNTALVLALEHGLDVPRQMRRFSAGPILSRGATLVDPADGMLFYPAFLNCDIARDDRESLLEWFREFVGRPQPRPTLDRPHEPEPEPICVVAEVNGNRRRKVIVRRHRKGGGK